MPQILSVPFFRNTPGGQKPQPILTQNGLIDAYLRTDVPFAVKIETFYQRVSIAIYANRRYSQRRNVRLSVRLSVCLYDCLSHSGIVSKRRKVAS